MNALFLLGPPRSGLKGSGVKRDGEMEGRGSKRASAASGNAVKSDLLSCESGESEEARGARRPRLGDALNNSHFHSQARRRRSGGKDREEGVGGGGGGGVWWMSHV